MKRKPAFWIVLGVVAVVVIVGVVMAKQYYDDRYVGTPHYAMVPLDYDVTPETIKSDSGADIGPGVRFELTAFDASGTAKEVEFVVFSNDDPSVASETMPKPGEYLEINASKTVVVDWGFTTEGDVPQAALAKIKSQ
jgi:uncharacterized protein (TIGR01655 family)